MIQDAGDRGRERRRQRIAGIPRRERVGVAVPAGEVDVAAGSLLTRRGLRQEARTESHRRRDLLRRELRERRGVRRLEAAAGGEVELQETGAADLVIHPNEETLRELRWRPGWRVCLATPSWPDGEPCDIASREVFRHVLDDVGSLGYEVMAAIEYEIRIWDEEDRPLSSAGTSSARNPP